MSPLVVLKRFTIMSICISLLMYSGTTTNSVDIEIIAQDKSPVTIELCAGETSMNLEGFEEKLKYALSKAGVELSDIRIKAGSQQTISSSGAGAQEILNTWKVFPEGMTGFTVNDKYLMAPNAENWSGFMDPNSLNAAGDISVDMVIRYRDPPQAIGFMLKVHNQSGSSSVSDTMDKYEFYVIVLTSGWSDDYQGYLSLFKIVDYDLFNPDNISKGGPVPWMTQKYGAAKVYLSSDRFLGKPEAGSYCFHNYITSAADPYTRMCYFLADKKVPGLSVNNFIDKPIHIQASYSNGTIHVSLEGTEYINYTDPDPIEVGGWGFGNISIFNSDYSDILIEAGHIPDLIDTVRNPDTAPNSRRFIVDVCDVSREDFSIPAKVGELTQRLQQDGVHYIGWGTDNSKASIESFIEHNSGKGIYLNQEQDVYKKTADYIASIVNKRLRVLMMSI